jgi:hypothetical protein
MGAIMNEKVEIVSTERGRKLLEKWRPILNAPLLTEEEYKKKLENSIMLEPQESYFCSTANKWKVKK